MKIYISADIEGVAGIAHWDETKASSQEYAPFRERMTREVAAACRACLDAGADEIWVKDAHGNGRNLDAETLPEEVSLVRGWSGHPFSMVQELDDSFDALLLLGYHAGAGSDGNPLAHTFSGRLSSLLLNGLPASEFLVNAYAAASVGVPVPFVSGDAALCEHVREVNPGIVTWASLRGVGDSVVSLHPERARKGIAEGVRHALAGDVDRCLLTLPSMFLCEATFRHHAHAYRASFYPGAQASGSHGVRFACEAYLDLLAFLSFAV